MNLPYEIWNIIDKYCDDNIRMNLLRVNKLLNMMIMNKYARYIVCWKRGNFIWDNYVYTVHHSYKKMINYIRNYKKDYPTYLPYIKIIIINSIGINLTRNQEGVAIYECTLENITLYKIRYGIYI
jgi:hypothetical protein